MEKLKTLLSESQDHQKNEVREITYYRWAMDNEWML